MQFLKNLSLSNVFANPSTMPIIFQIVGRPVFKSNIPQGSTVAEALKICDFTLNPADGLQIYVNGEVVAEEALDTCVLEPMSAVIVVLPYDYSSKASTSGIDAGKFSQILDQVGLMSAEQRLAVMQKVLSI